MSDHGITVRGDGTSVSRAVRRAWWVLGSAFTIVVLGFGTLQAVTQVAHEEHVESHAFPPAGVSVVDVESDAGNVEIVGSADARISVRARVSDGLRSTDHDVGVVGDRLEVRARCPGFLTSFCRVDYTLRVPTTVQVVVRAEDDVQLTDIDGPVDVTTGGGGVSARRLSGRTLRLQVTHGSIDVIDVTSPRVEAMSEHGDVALELADSPESVDAASEHGDVEIVVPRSTVAYHVDASSEHGSVETPIRTDPSSDRTIVARSDHGDVSVRYGARS